MKLFKRFSFLFLLAKARDVRHDSYSQKRTRPFKYLWHALISNCWRFINCISKFAHFSSLVYQTHTARKHMIFSSIYASSMLLNAIRMVANILKCFFFISKRNICSINWKRHFKSITELKMTLNRLCYADIFLYFYIFYRLRLRLKNKVMERESEWAA